MKLSKWIFLAMTPLLFASCVSLQPVTLQPVRVTINAPIDQYTYFYITPTEAKTGSSGDVYGDEYGVYGSTSGKSTNPADIISGFMIKRGMVRLPNLKDDLSEKTIIVNYGETGRRSTGLGYTIEVTLQIISAKTNEVICVATGEGQGETEADDIRIAINRCLNELYQQ